MPLVALAACENGLQINIAFTDEVVLSRVFIIQLVVQLRLARYGKRDGVGPHGILAHALRGGRSGGLASERELDVGVHLAEGVEVVQQSRAQWLDC